MSKLKIELKDVDIVDVMTDEDYDLGCPTCNYGSRYINWITFYFSNNTSITYEVVNMYEYLMSVGDLMVIILNSIEEMKQIEYDEFKEWFKGKMEELEKEHGFDTEITYEVEEFSSKYAMELEMDEERRM